MFSSSSSKASRAIWAGADHCPLLDKSSTSTMFCRPWRSFAMRGASLVLIARGAWGVNVVLRHMRRCHFHKLTNIFLPHHGTTPIEIGKKIYAVNRFILTHPYTLTFRLGVLRAFRGGEGGSPQSETVSHPVPSQSSGSQALLVGREGPRRRH